MSALPVRLRLTLVFAGVMAVVLGATGLFLYLRLGDELDETIDQGLRLRAEDLAALLERSSPRLGELGDLGLEEQSVAQLMTVDGAVVASSPQAGTRPVLPGRALARARERAVFAEPVALTGSDQRFRVLAMPVSAAAGPLIVVVGTSVDRREEALTSLGALLALGGPAALLLASVAGYGLATAALRPVEAMRREAAAVASGGDTGKRLPVPRTRDELARLGATLNEMIDRLERALQRERTFVSNASHELRTPLSILTTELELARRGGSVEELRAALRSAWEEADRLSRLAEDLLVIARAEEGELPVRRSRVDVADILERVAGRFAARAELESRRLVTDTPPAQALLADPLRLEQALGNMVDNALRHGAGTVAVSGRTREGRVELHVADEGTGVAPELARRAFERFTHREGGGTGLGLAVVDAIARAHRGSVGIDSRPGGGADVWLSLPAGEPEEAQRR